jgi:hypothetical protein
MSWIKSLFLNRTRRLEISTAGKWFVGFTIFLGVVAIYSGNNVIYLLESLLLSCLIFSGIISEYTVSRIQLSREVRELFADGSCNDVWILTNPTIFPLYCIEVGEVRDGKFEPFAFCVFLKSKSVIRLPSNQGIAKRGIYHWDGIGIATSFPFGFAKKIRIEFHSGSRIVWPKLIQNPAANLNLPTRELEVVDGELQELNPWEDVGKVHWPSSGKDGRLYTRPYRNSTTLEEVEFDLEKKDFWEEQISQVASRFSQHARVLILKQKSKAQKVEGKIKVLDALALLPEEK